MITVLDTTSPLFSQIKPWGIWFKTDGFKVTRDHSGTAESVQYWRAEVTCSSA